MVAASPPDWTSRTMILRALTGKGIEVNSCGANQETRQLLRIKRMAKRVLSLVFVFERVMIAAELSSTLSTEKTGSHLLSFVSGLTIRSPLTMRFWRLGLPEAKSLVNARVLTREGQKPWKVSAFSHQVWIRISRPDRLLTFIDSRSDKTVSGSLLIKKANGTTRLYIEFEMEYLCDMEDLTWRKVAVFADVIRKTIACNSWGRTGRTVGPARRRRWMMRSPIGRPPDSSWPSSRRAMRVSTQSRPLRPFPSLHANTWLKSLRMTRVRQEMPF